MLLAPVWVVLWIAHILLSFTLSVVGAPLIVYLAATRQWFDTTNPLGKPIKLWSPKWAWIWGNLEDGVIPPPTVQGIPYHPGWPDWLRAIAWCAWRNKVSNLRFSKYLGFTIDPSRVGFLGNDRNLYEPLPNDARPVLWSLAWQGVYAGLWILWRGSGRQFRIGWTLVPDDAKGYNANDLRQRYCGFSLQLNRG